MKILTTSTADNVPEKNKIYKSKVIICNLGKEEPLLSSGFCVHPPLDSVGPPLDLVEPPLDLVGPPLDSAIGPHTQIIGY